MLLRRRVLFVCADPALMLTVQAQFASGAYEVFATPDHRACARQVYELQPDVVLMAATNTPFASWLASLRLLRSLSQVPVVALIGSGDEAERAAAEACGADVCVMPPFEGERVAAAVEGKLMHVRETV